MPSDCKGLQVMQSEIAIRRIGHLKRLNIRRVRPCGDSPVTVVDGLRLRLLVDVHAGCPC